MPHIIHIVAMTPDGVIGVNDQLPFKLSEDLKQFKNLTENHLVCMGFNTFKSINDNHLAADGSFLKDRKVVVFCSDPAKVEQRSKLYKFDNVTFLNGETARRLINHNREAIIVVGGVKLFELYSPTIVIATVVDVPEPVSSPTNVIHKYPVQLSKYFKMSFGKKTSSTNLSYETSIYTS